MTTTVGAQAAELLEVGVPVARSSTRARIRRRRGRGPSRAVAIRAPGIEIVVGAIPLAAKGRGRVSGLRVRTTDGERTIAGDLVAMACAPNRSSPSPPRPARRVACDATLGGSGRRSTAGRRVLAGHLLGSDDLAIALASAASLPDGLPADRPRSIAPAASEDGAPIAAAEAALAAAEAAAPAPSPRCPSARVRVGASRSSASART